MATGNGTYNTLGHDWGDSVLALSPDGTGAGGNPLDSYTPTNFQSLQSSDTDLGGTAPAILPVPAGAYPNATYRHVAVQGGKDSLLRLLNLDNLSGQGGPGHTGGEIGSVAHVPQGNEVLTQPAVWTDGAGKAWIFVANDSGLSGLQLTVDASGAPGLHSAWTNPTGGSSPLVANGVLYDAAQDGTVKALDPATGHPLWAGAIGGVHWESPIVAEGTL